jgi:uncharacterized protein YcbK (DUF882 family)
MLSIYWRERNLRLYYACYNGKIDNIEGKQLKKAYGKYQGLVGLKQDEIYGTDTDSSLINSIKDIQRKLNQHGYNLVEDGYAGNSTENSLYDFQMKNGLHADKIVGDATMSKLNNTSSLSWNDIKHFKREEMTCKCGCGLNNTDLHLMQILEQIREHFGGKPVIITSGCRCKKHNANLSGSASNSKHLYGKAADIYIKGVSTSNLLSYTQSLVKNGTLRYTYTNSRNMNGVVHVDIN